MKKWKSVVLGGVVVLSVLGCGKIETEEKETVESGYGYNDEPRYDWEIPEGAFSHHNSILYVRELGSAAGANAIVPTNDYGVGATDLGFPFVDEEKNRVYFLWGDTFSENYAWMGNWTSSALLYTDHLDFTQGIRYDGVVSGRQGTVSVTPITNNVATRQNNADLGLTFESDEVTGEGYEVWTNIPTGGIVIDGTIYVYYMEVGRFGSTTWDTFSGRVVKSTDGSTWEPCKELVWQGKDVDGVVQNAANFNQIFPYEDGGYIYIYGIPGGRLGGIKLGRVLKENIEKFEEYEYLTGYEDDGKTPVWVKGSDGLNAVGADNYDNFMEDGTYIINRVNCGEVCVFYNQYLKKYLLTYFTGNGLTINMHYSETPYGPWSDDSIQICKTGDVGVGLGIYAGLSHEIMSTNQGQRIFMIVSETHNQMRTSGYIPRYIEIVFR